MFGRKKPTTKKRKGVAVSMRGFAAAAVDRLLAGWRYDGGYTACEISAHLETIRARSRQMAKDNPHLKRFLQLAETNIVGEGFSFKSTPPDMNGQKVSIDTQAAKFIEFHWRNFCTYREPETTATWFDITGIKTEAEMDRMNVKTWARDGEYFIHIIKGAANPYGVSFRVLRPDWCDHTYNLSDTGSGTMITAGVERDINTRRPVAYWFMKAPRSAYGYNVAGAAHHSIPASEIIHGFTQEDEDQPRGIPWAHSALRKLKMLDEYDVAELTAARDEACSTRSYQASDSSDMDELIDLTDPDNSEVANALTMEKQAGQAEIVPRGWEMKINTPQHPNRELTNFKNSMLRDVATGFGVEYANFANDWAAVNFSSVRAGTITERDSWKVLQSDMISQCKQVQFLVWLKSFLTYSVSGDLPLSKLPKFSSHSFRGRRWMWIDPTKDMKAAELARNNMWKTDTDIAADLGYDYDDNLATMEREADSREAAGFSRSVGSAESPANMEGKEDANDED